MLTEIEKKLLNDYFEQWEEFVRRYNPDGDHPGLTKRLEKEGQKVYLDFKKSPVDVLRLRRFLEDIGKWKMPWYCVGHVQNVNGNSDMQILNVFEDIITAPSDETKISACTMLKGFGQGQGQTRMASAILRFLWPGAYGVVDWRNWMVLSNFRHKFLEHPPLCKLGGSLKEYRECVINKKQYVEYNEKLREIRDEVAFTKLVADIDLALWAYSIGIFPFNESYISNLTKKSNNLNRYIRPTPQKDISFGIFETFLEDWKNIDCEVDLKKRYYQKLQFLWECYELIPKNAISYDKQSDSNQRYYLIYKRDLDEKVSELHRCSDYQKRLNELESLFWNKLLKGQSLGVIGDICSQ